ncbi:unnamed protein product [Arctogadus glacialis]
MKSRAPDNTAARRGKSRPARGGRWRAGPPGETGAAAWNPVPVGGMWLRSAAVCRWTPPPNNILPCLRSQLSASYRRQTMMMTAKWPTRRLVFNCRPKGQALRE